MDLHLERKVDMQMMNKKFLSFTLCIFLSFSLTACSSSQLQEMSDESSEIQHVAEGSSNILDTQESVEDSEDNSQDGLEDLNMTDEELLEALGDNIHVVLDEDYFETVADFKEKTDDYMGQIYQLEGIYSKEKGESYIVRADTDGNMETGLPLKYVTKEPEEGAAVRITGIVNFGEVSGETVAVLDVAVIQTLD